MGVVGCWFWSLQFFSTLGSPQIWKGAMTNCHVILSLHWRPYVMSHLDTSRHWNGLSCHIVILLKPTNDIPNDIPFGEFTYRSKTICHVILVISLKPSNDIPNEVPFGHCTYQSKPICHVILSFHWNPQMTSQKRSHLETLPTDLKPFVMSYWHFNWGPKWHLEQSYPNWYW
jgi:hypothetical protein